MKKSILFLCASMLLVPLTGCTVAKVNSKGSIPVIMNQPAEKVTVIKTFKEKKKRVFDWTRSYELTELTGKVAKETNADALTNVDFKIKHGFSDYLINVFTLGLAQSTTLEITGDAVKYDSNISTQK